MCMQLFQGGGCSADFCGRIRKCLVDLSHFFLQNWFCIGAKALQKWRVFILQRNKDEKVTTVQVVKNMAIKSECINANSYDLKCILAEKYYSKFSPVQAQSERSRLRIVNSSKIQLH